MVPGDVQDKQRAHHPYSQWIEEHSHILCIHTFEFNIKNIFKCEYIYIESSVYFFTGAPALIETNCWGFSVSEGNNINLSAQPHVFPCFSASPNVCMAVARSSHNFCSLRGKVTSLFSRGYNVNLLATFVSDRSGAQIVVGTLTRLLHAGQKDNERKRKGDVGENKIRLKNKSKWVRMQKKSQGSGKNGFIQ